MQAAAIYGCIILVVFLFIVCMSKLPMYYKHRELMVDPIQLKTIGGDARRMFHLAKQDHNPFVALMLATIALGKLHTLRQMGPNYQVSDRLDLDLNEFQADVSTFIQQKLDDIATMCPNLPVRGVDVGGVDWFV